MKMKKINYLVLLCCLFITQGIFAQNMHRAVTINGVTVADFKNKTVVMKFNNSSQVLSVSTLFRFYFYNSFDAFRARVAEIIC